MNFSKIENYLYLSNESTALNKVFLVKHKIKRIISLVNETIPRSKQMANIYYKHITVEDNKTKDIITYFPECCHFISIGETYGNNQNIYQIQTFFYKD